VAARLLSEKNQKKSILKLKNELARNKRAFKFTLTNRVFFAAFIWSPLNNFLVCADLALCQSIVCFSIYVYVLRVNEFLGDFVGIFCPMDGIWHGKCCGTLFYSVIERKER